MSKLNRSHNPRTHLGVPIVDLKQVSYTLEAAGPVLKWALIIVALAFVGTVIGMAWWHFHPYPVKF